MALSSLTDQNTKKKMGASPLAHPHYETKQGQPPSRPNSKVLLFPSLATDGLDDDSEVANDLIVASRRS